MSKKEEPSTPRPKKKKEKEKKEKKKDRPNKRGKEKEPEVIQGSERKGPVILSPFDEVASVWSLPSRKAQRALIGELFEIPDGAGLCRDSILLDLAFLDLLFAHQAGLNIEQTKVFWTIMQTMQTNLIDAHHTLEKTMEMFKRSLLENSVYNSYFVEPPSSRSQAPSRTNSSTNLNIEAAVKKEEEEDVEPTSAGRRSTSRTKKGSRRRKADSQQSNPVSAMSAAFEEEEETEVAPNPARLFTTENIKQITEYVVAGFLTHFRLYRCVLNPKVFQPRKELETHTFRVETIVDEDFMLDNATNTTANMDASISLSPQRSTAMSSRAAYNRDLESSMTRDGDGDAISRDQGNASAASRSATFQDDQQWNSDQPPLDAFPLQEEVTHADPVLMLVDRHTQNTRSEMARMLEENQKALEAKLAETLGETTTSSKSRNRNR